MYRQQWRNSLRDHAASLKNKLIKEIGTVDVLAALQPIWLSKPETASRVRGRIERILAAAKVCGFRPIESANPALWKGHLELLLPRKSKLTRGHHAALRPEAPAFMTALRKRPGPSARSREFTILTPARSGETLGAIWGEVDLKQKLWTIPGSRMKAGEERVVPLSSAAVALLEKLRPAEPEARDLIFAVRGTARSNMAMAMLLRRTKYEVTTHVCAAHFVIGLGTRQNFRVS